MSSPSILAVSSLSNSIARHIERVMSRRDEPSGIWALLVSLGFHCTEIMVYALGVVMLTSSSLKKLHQSHLSSKARLNSTRVTRVEVAEIDSQCFTMDRIKSRGLVTITVNECELLYSL